MAGGRACLHDIDGMPNGATAIELGNNMANFKKVVIAEGIIAFIFYALTGVAGYMTWGSLTGGNVLSNYDKSDQGALWARLTCAFSVIFTYPFGKSVIQRSAVLHSFNWSATLTSITATIVISTIIKRRWL
jgi:amino acid permease